jgi:hypothetical protein
MLIHPPLSTYFCTLFYSVLFLLIASTSHSTEVYISIDEQGNRVFSDQPSKESRKHKVKEISIIPAIKIPAKTADADDKKSEVAYQSLTITSPLPETNFTRDYLGNISISAQLEPSLQDHDEAVLFVNGQEIEASSNLSWQLTNTDRGEHSLQIIVRSKKDQVEKITSQAITVYIQR